MKFLADMGISPRIVSWLKSNGYDAIHLGEQGLEKLPDDEILIKALNEQRIILTVDLDFAQLLAISQESLPSVVLFRLGNETCEVMNQFLVEVLNRFESELETGVIISVTDKSFRIRRLPI